MAYSNPTISTTSINETESKTPPLHQLDTILVYIIQQLADKYLTDRTATNLLRKLKELQQIRHKHPNSILECPIEADQFAKMDLSQDDKKHHPGKSALVYLLKIAFCDALPKNRKDNDGHFKVIHNKEQLIASKDQLMSTGTGYLHFPHFVIEPGGPFYWQDQIRALYYIKPSIPPQASRILQKDPKIEEEDLEILGVDDGQQHGALYSLSLERIDYYYEMIYRAATQHTILHWDNECKKDKNFSDWVLQLCRYSTILRKKNYCIEEAQLEQLNSKQEELSKDIKKYQLSKEYFQFTDKTPSDLLQESIERFLSNLASPLFLQEGILRFSSQQRIELERVANYSREYIAGLKSHYRLLAKNKRFHTFLEKTNLTKEGFFEIIKNAGTAEAIIDHLRSSGVLYSINRLQSLGVLSVAACKELVFSPEKLEQYTDTIKTTAFHIQSTRSNTLDEFIENYNRTRGKTKISLTDEERERLPDLEELSKNFQQILRNPLPKEVLYNSEHGCENLIDALDKYGNLAQLLQDKKFEKILYLAHNYCFNAQNEIVLNAIKLSELPPEQALAFSNDMRLNLKKYYRDLLSLITGRYTLKSTTENREKYVYQHLKYMLTYHVHSEQAFSSPRVLLDSVENLSHHLLIGLVQRKMLAFDEIFTIGDSLAGRLYGANAVYYNEVPQSTQARVQKAGFLDLAHIISKVPALIAQRNELKQLKDGDNQQHYKFYQEKYLSDLIDTIECIVQNLHSFYSESIKQLGIAGFSFPEAITISRFDRDKIQEDYDKACAQWADKKNSELFQIINIKKREDNPNTKPIDLQALSHHIRENNPNTKPIDLFANVCQVIKYASSQSIIKLYQQGFLTIGKIAILTPSAAAHLEENLEILELNNPKFKDTYDDEGLKYIFDCLKCIFIQHTEKTSKITQTHIQNIIQDFQTVIEGYLDKPLLQKITFEKDTPVQEFVDAVQAFGSKEREKSWGEQEEEWKDRFLAAAPDQVKHYYKERKSILRRYRTYSNFLYSAFLRDPVNQGIPFSIQNIIDCCEQYLDNLDNPNSYKFIKLGFDRIVAFTAIQEQRDDFFSEYYDLENILNSLKQTSNETHEKPENLLTPEEVHDILGYFIKTSIQRNRSIKTSIQRNRSSLTSDIEAVTSDIEVASQNLETPDIVKQVLPLLPLITVMLLPTALLEDISTLLKRVTQDLPETYIIKFYSEFQEWFDNIYKASEVITSESPLQKSINTLKCSISIELLRCRYTIDEVLSALRDKIDTINSWLAVGDSDETVQACVYLERHKYTSFSHMIVDCFIQSPKYSLEQLPRFLETRIKLLQAHPHKIERLTSTIPLQNILNVDKGKQLESLYKTSKKYEQDPALANLLLAKIAEFHNPNPDRHNRSHRRYSHSTPQKSSFWGFFSKKSEEKPEQPRRRHRSSH